MNIKMLVIGDIHFGYYPANKLYDEFSLVIETIENKSLDVVMIAGDYFDTRLSLSSPHSVYAIKAFCDLIKVCEENGVKLRMIRGTASHDPENQLNNLANIAKSSKCDFKLFNTVGEEELFPDFKVFYIPEEYMENKDEYYKDFFNKNYQCVIGHGMFEETNFSSHKASTMKKYPVFNSKFMQNLCEGPIVFGHIHTSQRILDRIMYTGSFTRSRFGEEEEKGFVIGEYDTEEKTTKFEFIVNEKATDFKTITIEKDSVIFNMLVNDQIKHIRELVDKYKKDKLRIKINIPDDYDNAKIFIDNINIVFSSVEDVTINIVDDNKDKIEKDAQEKINMLMNKYSFIFNKNIPYDEKIKEYIKIKKGKDVSLEHIRQLITGNKV